MKRCVRLRKNVFSLFRYLKRMKEYQKKIYDEKVTGRSGRRRPRLIFENAVSKILEEGDVNSMRTPRRACMKGLITVDEAKEVCRDRSVWRSILPDYAARDTA